MSTNYKKNEYSTEIEGQGNAKIAALVPSPPPTDPTAKGQAPLSSGRNCLPMLPLPPARTLDRLPPGPTASKSSMNVYCMMYGTIVLLLLRRRIHRQDWQEKRPPSLAVAMIHLAADAIVPGSSSGIFALYSYCSG